MLRAGVVAALAVGALLVAPSPAQAAPPDVSLSPTSATVNAGSDVTVTVNVTTKLPTDTSVEINPTGLPPGVSCSSGCGSPRNVTPDTATPLLIRLRAQSGAPAANGVEVTVGVEAASGANTAKLTLTVNAAPPSVPQNVKDVTVKVFDSGTGQALAGALLIIEDSAGTQWNVQAGSNGQVRITSSQSKPIQPGEVSVVAGMDGYQNLVKTGQGRAGQSLVIEMRLVSATVPTPTGELTQSVPTDTADPTTSEEAVNPNLAGNDEGGGGLSWMLIVMGGLLVALGVGAIVLLLLRRRDDGEEGEVVENPAYAPRGPAPLPAGRSVYRGGGPPPAIAGPQADRTMVTRQPMDAPTMMHRPNEYGPPGPRPPQPYGQPVPPPPGYGQPPYPTSPSPAYGAPAYPSAPASPGYGPPAPAPRSAEPYRGGEYGDRGYAGGYGVAEPRQYDDGYGQATSNYGAPQGYGPPQNYDAGYGPPQQSYDGGYGSAGYDQGYDPRGGGYGGGGYERVPEQRNGYEQQGYDAGAGYYDEPTTRRPASPSRSERRSLDWLDD